MNAREYKSKQDIEKNQVNELINRVEELTDKLSQVENTSKKLVAEIRDLGAENKSLKTSLQTQQTQHEKFKKEVNEDLENVAVNRSIIIKDVLDGTESLKKQVMISHIVLGVLVIVVLTILVIMVSHKDKNIAVNIKQSEDTTQEQKVKVTEKKNSKSKKKQEPKELKENSIKTPKVEVKHYGSLTLSDIKYTIENYKLITFEGDKESLDIVDTKVESGETDHPRVYVLIKDETRWRELEDYKFILKE